MPADGCQMSSGYRCGECDNCQALEKTRQLVLACCNPPFSHADDGVIQVWNDQLIHLKCTSEDPDNVLSITMEKTNREWDRLRAIVEYGANILYSLNEEDEGSHDEWAELWAFRNELVEVLGASNSGCKGDPDVEG